MICIKSPKSILEQRMQYHRQLAKNFAEDLQNERVTHHVLMAEEIQSLITEIGKLKISDYILTSEQVAQLLKIDKTTVIRKVQKKELPSEMISGAWLFLTDDINQF